MHRQRLLLQVVLNINTNVDYKKYLAELEDLNPAVTQFFNDVLVMDKDENVKNVSGKTLGEAELSQIMLYGIEINTETDIAREEYKIPTTFYNPDHPEASLVDRLMEKAPHYTITHIDKSLMDIQSIIRRKRNKQMSSCGVNVTERRLLWII